MWRLLGAATDWAAGRYKLSRKRLFVSIYFKTILLGNSTISQNTFKVSSPGRRSRYVRIDLDINESHVVTQSQGV